MADREDVTMLRNVPRSSEVAGDTGLPRESILATASALEAAAATDDEAADAQHKFIWQSVGLACGHTLSASTLTVANKWALEVYPYATTVTGLQVAFTILVVLVIKLSGCYPVDKLEFAKAWHYFPAASMFFLTMVAGNMVIAYASVQVFVVMRAVIPAVTFALDWLLLGGPKPTCTSYAWLCVMIGGGGMFFTQNTEPLTWPAIAWALVFLAIMPIDSLLVKKALTDIEFETWGRVYYQNLLALMMYLPMSLLTGEMSEALQLGSIASEPDVLLPLAVTCVLGLSISFFQLNLRNVIRATTFTLLGVLNKVLSVILDAFTTAQTPISITAIVGIVIMIIGGVGWTCVLGVKGVLTIKKQADNIEVYTGPPKWVSYYNGGFVVVTLLSLFTGPIIPAGPAPPPPPGTYPSALLNATSVAESGHCVRVTPSEPNGTYLDSINRRVYNMGIVPWEMPYCDWFSDWQAPADNPLLVKYAEASSSFMMISMDHVAPASWQPLPAAYYTTPASTGDWQYHLPNNISWFGTRAGCQEACGAIVGCQFVAIATNAGVLPEIATECFLGVPGTHPEFWYEGESRWTIYGWSLAYKGVEREDWVWSSSTPLVRTANGSCGMYTLQDPDLPPSVDNGFGEAVLLGTFIFNTCPTVLTPKVAATKLDSKLPTFNPAITFAPPNVKAEFGPEAEYIVFGDSIVDDLATFGQCIRCSTSLSFDCRYFGTVSASVSNSNFSDWNYTSAVYILDAQFRTIAQTPLATDPAFMASFPPGRYSNGDPRVITGSNGQIYAAVVNYMGSDEIDTADPSWAGLMLSTSPDQGADLWAGSQNLGGLAWSQSEVVGEVHITKGGGAVLTRTTVVTAGAASGTVAHKNPGLFEHDGVLMALDWAIPAMVMPLHAIDDWANRPAETIRGADLYNTSASATLLAERLGLAGLLSWSSSSSKVGTGASTVHNGPNLVALPGNAGYLGVAHISRRWAGPGGEWDNHYTSFVFKIAPVPPFALTAVSAEFCLDSIHRPGTNQCETIQFISGLLLSADGTELIIGTGLMDCESAFYTFDLSTILGMLRPVSG